MEILCTRFGKVKAGSGGGSSGPWPTKHFHNSQVEQLTYISIRSHTITRANLMLIVFTVKVTLKPTTCRM